MPISTRLRSVVLDVLHACVACHVLEKRLADLVKEEEEYCAQAGRRFYLKHLVFLSSGTYVRMLLTTRAVLHHGEIGKEPPTVPEAHFLETVTD